jgi:hypothetical protein
VSRSIDFERRNRVALMRGLMRSAISVPVSASEAREACEGAIEDADKDGLIKHNAKRFVIGLNPGEPCLVKIKDGTVIRGKYVADSGPKRVKVSTDAGDYSGEWVPES